MFRRILALSLTAAAAALPQDTASLSGPVLGYASLAGSLHVLFGIPGLATWSPALLPGLEQVAVARNQSFGLTGAGGELRLILRMSAPAGGSCILNAGRARPRLFLLPGVPR
jgi:hypothetical protein